MPINDERHDNKTTTEKNIHTYIENCNNKAAAMTEVVGNTANVMGKPKKLRHSTTEKCTKIKAPRT